MHSAEKSLRPTRQAPPGAWRPALLAMAGALGMYALLHLLSAAPSLAERVFFVVDALVTRPLSRLTGLVPVSVMELLVLGYLLWIAGIGFVALRSVLRGRRRTAEVLGSGARRAVRDVSLFVIVFYAAWGLNYARTDLSTQFGWTEWDGIEAEELEALARAASRAVNEAYLEVHGVPDAGVPTPLEDSAELEAAIDAGWIGATELLALPANAAARYGPVKRPLSTPLLLRLRIAGIYSPFTAEANVPRGVPAVGVPMTMAHEKAHQRGVTGEGDASFLAFIVSGIAPDPLARYSAALYAQGQLLGPLRIVAPEAMERLLASRLPGVQRDVADRRAFSARYAGSLSEMGSRMNDRYLRTNRVEAGVGDYARSARLIVEFARQNGGEPMPAPLPRLAAPPGPG